jgi:ASC-1-like (ASCH) protein
MAVRKKENGSLTGSKRYAAEKGKTVEEQSQQNHTKTMDKVKGRFQKPTDAVNAVADGVRNVAQGVKTVERAARTVRQAVTDNHKESLGKASAIASEYGIKEIEIGDLLGSDPYVADASIPEMKAADANREKLKIQRQNNALEVRLEKIKQGRKVVAVASEQRRLIGDFVDFATAGIEVATKVVKNEIVDTKYQTEQSKLEQSEELLYQQRVATQGTMNLTHGIEDEWQLKFQLQGAKNDRLRLEIEGSHRDNDLKREELEARLIEA